VRLVADVRNLRASYLGGGAALVTAGALGAAAMLVLGLLVPLAVLPAAAGAAGGFAVARTFRGNAAAIETAVAQVLDRLEHGEVKPEHLLGPRPSAFMRIADEIKKTFDQL
jgi:hypothetical protein